MGGCVRVLVPMYVHMCYNFFVHEDIIYPHWVMVYIVVHVCVSMNGEVCVCVCVFVSMYTICMYLLGLHFELRMDM